MSAPAEASTALDGPFHSLPSHGTHMAHDSISCPRGGPTQSTLPIRRRRCSSVYAAVMADKRFFCQMQPGITCDTAEEQQAAAAPAVPGPVPGFPAPL